MDYTSIKYEKADRILTITLNRPEKLNAVTNKMLFELIDAFDRADEDDDVRNVEYLHPLDCLSGKEYNYLHAGLPMK